MYIVFIILWINLFNHISNHQNFLICLKNKCSIYTYIIKKLNKIQIYRISFTILIYILGYLMYKYCTAGKPFVYFILGG